MTKIQQTIIEQMQFSQEATDNKIKDYKPKDDKLSVVFRLEDRQLTVTYNQWADVYSLTVHQLDEQGNPINGLIDFTDEVYLESLAYFFDVPLEELDFMPVDEKTN
jgi:hypothetical protein